MAGGEGYDFQPSGMRIVIERRELEIALLCASDFPSTHDLHCLRRLAWVNFTAHHTCSEFGQNEMSKSGQTSRSSYFDKVHPSGRN